MVLGDPTVGGWLIVAAYFIGAASSAWALRVARVGATMAALYEDLERRARPRASAYRASMAFWAVMTLLLFFLGVNKQLDLQMWLTAIGRRMAEAQGWYEERHRMQTAFVIVVAGLSMLTLGVLLYFTRELLPRHVAAIVGTVLLGFFVFVRASSFHDLDAALGVELMGIKIRWMLELAGVLLVGFSAAKNSWWHSRLPVPAAPVKTE